MKITLAELEMMRAGKGMDALVYNALERLGFPRLKERFLTPSPWSTNICSCFGLIESLALMYRPPLSIVLSVTDRFNGAHPFKLNDPQWTCVISGDENMDGWECEATGDTLPQAFCRAFLQEENDAHY